MVNGEKVLIVTFYLFNTHIDDSKRLFLSFTEVFSIRAEEGRNTIPLILAGDFNTDLKKENEGLEPLWKKHLV
jgi:endonuclease/exonuclease/phosphatase family metal-dependent hydrolase